MLVQRADHVACPGLGPGLGLLHERSEGCHRGGVERCPLALAFAVAFAVAPREIEHLRGACKGAMVVERGRRGRQREIEEKEK